MIYLAQPYSHSDPHMRRMRYLDAMGVCAWAFYNGRSIYSPIVHWHQVAIQHHLPIEALPWEMQNFRLISKCDEFWVLRLDGWEKSRGMLMEAERALYCNKTFYTVDIRHHDPITRGIAKPQVFISDVRPSTILTILSEAQNAALSERGPDGGQAPGSLTG